jgi:hypothetical protein
VLGEDRTPEELDAFLLQQQANSEKGFAKSVLIQLCKAFELEYRDRQKDSDFGFQWFHDQYPHFPIRLDSKKLKIDLNDMFRAMTRTEVWDAYMNALEETENEQMALFVAVPGHGTFVIHNCWHLPQVPGYTRLVRIAKTADKGIIFEPLNSFIESIRKAGLLP